jgi:bifunctional non-homologous end joining protein LigD
MTRIFMIQSLSRRRKVLKSLACGPDWWGRSAGRHGADFTDNMPRIAEAVRSLPADDVVLDGEEVVLKADGHSVFTALRTTRGAAIAQLVAFDILELDSEDQCKLPLEIRRAELGAVVAEIDAILFSEAIEAEGAIVFEKACEMNFERIVSKRLGGSYWSGRCRNWLIMKVKNPAFRIR